MNKKTKFVLFIIISIILSLVAPFVVSIIPTKEEPKIDVDKLQKEFSKTLETKLKEEREKTILEYTEALKNGKVTTDEIVGKYIVALTKFYGEGNKEIKTQYSADKKYWNISFGDVKERDLKTTNDTLNDTWNGYALNLTYELTNKDANVKQYAEIAVLRDNAQKFNIDNNLILIDLLNNILGRELTQQDKNAINIKVNMNLGDLTNIEDLKNYIYNTDAVKIDNMVIENENTLDVEKNRARVLFKITCERENPSAQKTETEKEN